MVVHYWLNRLTCWHGRKARAIEHYGNGACLYCTVCGRKRLTIVASATLVLEDGQGVAPD